MTISALPARANTGAGTDQLAVEDIAGKLAGVVRTTDDAGNGKEIATQATQADVAALLQEVCIRLCDIADSVGNLMPDVAGRLRVAAETVANISTITTVTTVSTVTTIGSLTNQAQIGGYAANQHIIALTQMAEGDLRRNIVIS
jgi:hypothetical protein